MKFREHLRLLEAKKAFDVGDKISWKNDDGDTLTGTIAKVAKDLTGTKVYKIKAKMNNKGKEILTTWPVGEILRKAELIRETEVEIEEDCDCGMDPCECDKDESEDDLYEKDLEEYEEEEDLPKYEEEDLEESKEKEEDLEEYEEEEDLEEYEEEEDLEKHNESSKKKVNELRISTLKKLDKGVSSLVKKFKKKKKSDEEEVEENLANFGDKLAKPWTKEDGEKVAKNNKLKAKKESAYEEEEEIEEREDREDERDLNFPDKRRKKSKIKKLEQVINKSKKMKVEDK